MSSSPTPAELTKNLQFDIMTNASSDTSLAKAYIDKHEGKFPPLTICYKENVFELDKYGNKIIPPYGWQEATLDSSQDSTNPIEPRAIKLKKVAKNIQKNADLFAQLEFLIRNISQEEVTGYDVKLIAERFDYYAMIRGEAVKKRGAASIRLRSYQPLAALGVAAEILYKCNYLNIFCDLDTAVVGHLFTEICYEAGFGTNQVTCGYFPDMVYNFRPFVSQTYFSGSVDGSVAIVTEKSDVDSAVEALMAATHNFRYPWRLRRIIVQESVYERFQKSLARKSEFNRDIKTSLKEQSAQTHFAKGKIFLFDYTGGEVDEEEPIIFVEAYRTTKELKSLLNKYRPQYVSLWCLDMSISNEITLETDPRVFWINDFGVFEEGGDVAHSFFTGYDTARFPKPPYYGKPNTEVEIINKLTVAADRVDKMREKWLKLTKDERVEIITKTFEEFKAKQPDVKDIISDKYWRTSSFTQIYNKRLIMGFCECIGVVGIFIEYNLMEQNMFDILNSIVHGNGVLLDDYSNKKWVYSDLVRMLGEAGVPIVSEVFDVDFYFTGEGHKDVKAMKYCIQSHMFNPDSLYRKKVISSRFGETFAN